MKSENQKLKIVYLAEILSKYTDEEHLLNASEIIEKLKDYGITAERKSIYNDINLLSDSGLLDIEHVGGRNGGFHVLSRKFELAELKMLVDAVQSSRFISNKQCASLIKKLSQFVSLYDESKLQRSVYIYDRAQDKEKNALYLIDSIHEAITKNRAIKFQYTDISSEKTRIKRHDGVYYEVSPFALIWRDELYYLIAFHHESESIRHFRVDRMENIILLEQLRKGSDAFEQVSLSKYSSNVFEMYKGEEFVVHFRAKNHLAAAMFDRFGMELKTYPRGDEFEFYSPVQVSVRFFGWVFGFAGELEILSPKNVVDEYKKQINKVLKSL